MAVTVSPELYADLALKLGGSPSRHARTSVRRIDERSAHTSVQPTNGGGQDALASLARRPQGLSR